MYLILELSKNPGKIIVHQVYEATLSWRRKFICGNLLDMAKSGNPFFKKVVILTNVSTCTRLQTSILTKSASVILTNNCWKVYSQWAIAITIATSLEWVLLCTIGLFTVSVSDCDVAITKSGMGVAPILAISDSLYILYKIANRSLWIQIV